MNKRFENKIALITGGNSGMGKATAKLLKEEGATVIITGRDEKTLTATAKELGVTAIRSDASNLKDIDALLAQIKQKFDGLDIIFANAGIAKFFPLSEATEEAYDSIMNANVKGVFFLVKKAVPLLRKGGSVILNASVAARKGDSTVYGASKAAVRALGRSFAKELLPLGVRVNVISPGPIDTPIYDRPGGFADGRGMLGQFAAGNPMKRAGTVEEIAHTVAFLASDEASYIVGVDLLVDGGLIEL